MHLGIDFGTCFTSAAVLTGNQFYFVRDDTAGTAQLAYPSAAYLAPDGELLLGTLARSMARRDPSRFRQEFKRDLGSNTPYAMGDRMFLPQDLIARMLARLKAEAETTLGAPLPAVVLTVPASYNTYRRQLMVEAGVAAGFRKDGVVLIDEPEAAALAYDWQLKQRGRSIPEGAIVLVYDLGGGTFDIALMRKEGEHFRSLAPAIGDPHCGGIDFDRAIYQEIASIAGPELQELLAPDNMSASALRMRLELANYCRDAKHQLTTRQEYDDVLPGPGVEDFQLTRADFEAKIAQYVNWTIELCNELLASANCTWNHVSGLLLVGGSSRIPYVTSCLTEASGRPLWQMDDPQLAVCMGAAVRPGYQRILKDASQEPTEKPNFVLISNSGSTINLWELSTGKLLPTMPGDISHKLFPIGVSETVIGLWDTSLGKLTHNLTGHTARIRSFTLSPNGKIVASGSDDKTIKLWNTATGQLIRTLTGHTDSVRSVILSPDNTMIASCSDDTTIRIWEAATGRQIRTLAGHKSLVMSVAFHRDGKTLASCSYDKSIKLWNASTGELLRTMTGHTSAVYAVAISPDGKILASGGIDKTVNLWDTASGELIQTLTGHTGTVYALAFSPDGKIVAAGSETIILWNTLTGRAIQKFLQQDGNARHAWNLTFYVSPNSSSQGHTNRVRVLTKYAEGKSFASGSDDQTIIRWDVETGNAVGHLQNANGKIAALTSSADGAHLISGADSLYFWDSISLKKTEPVFGPTQHINAAALSLDEKLVATVNDEAQVCLWNRITRKPIHAFTGHEGKVHTVVFSPDNSIVFSGSADGTLKAWSVDELRPLYTLSGHTEDILSVAIAPDGQTLASAGKDGTVRLWDVSTKTPIHTLNAHTEAVHSVTFSSDGGTIASAGADGTIRLWNVATGDPLNTLAGHNGAVNAVLFVGEDTRLISGGDDRSVRFWKLDWA